MLLLVGAFAKSAQIPLHTWLPDAMEGPTPVSALIHAATMVTAGVYLIARMHPLFERAPAAQDVGAVIGAATLLIAGTIALTQTDIKRVIAYSTMSQIGYMIMGVSVGAYAAGLFHLMTHAFFKALLFMAAGSLIGAMAGEQSLEKMGGFRKAMPFTYGCFIIGGLALSGIPPFSGFFSKDEILLITGERGGWHWALYVVGYIGAFLTAIYTFRMIFRAFHGEPVPEARELEGGPSAPRGGAHEPGHGRGGGHRRGLPRAHARDRRTRAADARGDGRARVGSHRRSGSCRSRKWTSSSTTSCARRSPDPRCTNPTRRPGCSWLGLVLGTLLGPRRDRDRLPRVGGPPGHGRGGASAPAPAV